MRFFAKKAPASPPAMVVSQLPAILKEKPAPVIIPKVEKDPARCRRWAIGTVHAHRNSGYYVNLRIDELAERAMKTDYCIYCDTKINWTKPKGKPARLDAPSLDRIDNSGYMDRNNVRIICLRCNIAKRNGTEAEYIAWLKQAGRHLNK